VSKSSVSAALNTHLQGEVTTTCRLWKVTRDDLQVFGYTDNVADVPYLGVIYKSADGGNLTSIESKGDMSVDNMDIETIFTDGGITESDLYAGLWNGAQVDVMLVNYLDLTMGHMLLKRGRIGDVQARGGKFVAELRGLSQSLQQSIGDVYQPTCRVDLGSTKCGINLATVTHVSTITSVTSRTVFADSTNTNASEWFEGGVLTFTTGACAGLRMEVRKYVNPGIFTLALSMPRVIAVGDGYSVYAGCKKRLIEDCKTKFNNVVNFRGEPYLPGIDEVLKPGGV
jgi:uncharacterized phage protein (TIGR02218 family)